MPKYDKPSIYDLPILEPNEIHIDMKKPLVYHPDMDRSNDESGGCCDSCCEGVCSDETLCTCLICCCLCDMS